MENIDLKNINCSEDMHLYINFKLAAMGQPYCFEGGEEDKVSQDTERFIQLTRNHIQNFQEKDRLLSDQLCPADRRIQNFLDEYLKNVDFKEKILLPHDSFILDQPGLAREISLPYKKNTFSNEYLQSYKIKQGVLHNPANDRRTTQGSFHIVEGGLPIPPDKYEVPLLTFAHLLHVALNPPQKLLELPYTSQQKRKASLFVSLYMRPKVCPEVKGYIPEKSMEVRYFVPGSLVSNLDFVESIFGNEGDPFLSSNDSALDFDHWSGHTGCMILAPHLTKLTKKEIGLPRWDDATEKQRKQGMCWQNPNECYNNGNPFKLTCRNDKGVVLTILADNYFGYSKKEIKTQISYAANLYGLCEEEHAGGAIAFPRKSLGDTFLGDLFTKKLPAKFEFADVKKVYGELMNFMPENYAIDKRFPNIIYIPEDSKIFLYEGKVTWKFRGKDFSLPLKPNNYYILPSGFKLHIEKHPSAPSWRLVSTYPEGTFIHKPCTVSGGGKSEIAKSLSNAIIYGSFYVHDPDLDFEMVDRIFSFNYANRWKEHEERIKPSRPVLDTNRSLGSVVKLLTPSPKNTDEYNDFLKSIPDHVKALVLFVKRFYRPERDGHNWREYFSVNRVNGKPGHVLLYNNRPIVASYLRLGFNKDGSWNLHKLRSDFLPCAKIQMEDDITASIVLPANKLQNLSKFYNHQSVKFTVNCENRFFQRPDEAVIRGYDIQAEEDLSGTGYFISNYEPLTPKNARDLLDNAISFDLYTDPIKKLIKDGASAPENSFFISPSHPRIVDGAPSKNPRYLQKRSDIENPLETYIAELGIRFFRKIPLDKPVYFPVNAVLPGRRNNPPDKKSGIRPLSVYNPIHYQELPELFMDFICSLTGKSPSTTGAGSEGALTKGPFNMLVPTTDLNNALLSYILTGYKGWTTAAGYIADNKRFDHDISVLIPELCCRMWDEFQNPEQLIQEGSLEKLKDFEHNGQKVLASRLGYRITEFFLYKYMGRVFDEPQGVFDKVVLKPESQNIETFVDGINNIVEAQCKVAKDYFKDGSIEAAIPPLKVLLHIMANGNYEGKDMNDNDLRKMFTREYVINSSWYKERLKLKQKNEIQDWENRLEYIKNYMLDEKNEKIVKQLKLKQQIKDIRQKIDYCKSDEYITELQGTIGSDPLFK